MMEKKPNIIFILIDDMGWRDLSCYGSAFYETPHIDSLANDGMSFTNAYAACPLCSPTRASFLTGKYPTRLKFTMISNHSGEKGKLVAANHKPYLDPEEYNLAKALRDNGYATWHVGKWHLGQEEMYWPLNQGFDVNIGGCGYGHPYYGFFSPWDIPTLPNGEDGEYLTDRLTDEAIALIENHNTKKPFFMYMAHYAVHIPIQAKEDDIGYFKDKAKRLKLDMVNPLVPGEYGTWERTRHDRLQRRVLQSDPVYAAMIKNLDDNIGRLIDTLIRNDVYDDTIIVFTSDNGGLSTVETSPTCNIPLHEGKGFLYDGGIREPLIVQYPKVVGKSSTSGFPVITTDFYPTFLELAGLPSIPEQHMDGISIAPLLRGEDSLDREAIFWHFPHYGNQGGTPCCAVRCGDYKLIRYFEDDSYELFNIKEDISEIYNIKEQYPEITGRLMRILSNWLHEMDAEFPAINPDWQA